MNELKVFEHEEFGTVRAVEIDGEPWPVGKDVAAALGYSAERNAIAAHVDDEDKLTHQISASGQRRDVTLINESGLYSLVLSSKLPGAKKFKRWVTSEVLPSIRKHGGYIYGQENMSDEELLAAALLMAQKKIEERDAKIAELSEENQIMQPKADYFDALVDRNLLTNFRDTAKELRIAPQEFNSLLVDKKYIYRNNKGQLLPYQPHVAGGLFQMKECANSNGWVGVQTMITPKGRETFRLLFSDAVNQLE